LIRLIKKKHHIISIKSHPTAVVKDRTNSATSVRSRSATKVLAERVGLRLIYICTMALSHSNALMMDARKGSQKGLT
jgi:hypothetical protein